MAERRPPRNVADDAGGTAHRPRSGSASRADRTRPDRHARRPAWPLAVAAVLGGAAAVLLIVLAQELVWAAEAQQRLVDQLLLRPDPASTGPPVSGLEIFAVIPASSMTLAGGLLAAALLGIAVAILLQHQRELRVGDRSLEGERDAAVSANRAKSQFVTVVSHDLRQPLQAITLLLAALRLRVTDPQALAVVADIDACTAVMLHMFAALLDPARVDADGIPVRPELLPVESVLTPLRRKFGPIARAKGLALEMPHCELRLWTDPILLESMLFNLLSNAVKYTARGTVTLTVRRDADELGIAVADTGIGIPAERHEDVFRDFVRLDATPGGRARGDRGLGLGLAIVRRLAQLQSGRVDLQSTPGVGSVFTLHLPGAVVQA